MLGLNEKGHGASSLLGIRCIFHFRFDFVSTKHLVKPHKGTKASMRLHAPAIEPHICFTEKKHFRQRTVVMLRSTFL